jgi:hypothetical protein
LPVNEEDEVYKFSSEGYIQQAVFDSVTNYVLCCHLRESSHWLAKSKGVKNSTEYGIHKLHETWSDILEKSDTTVEIVKQNLK